MKKILGLLMISPVAFLVVMLYVWCVLEIGIMDVLYIYAFMGVVLIIACSFLYGLKLLGVGDE